MTQMPLADVKNRFSEVVSRVERGEEISVTRRGKAIARIVPEKQARVRRSAEIRKVFARLKELSFDMDIGGDIKTIAREGAA